MEYNIKYRPQKISELDLVSVREGLERVFKSGKMPQAFLFAGPKGIGKTSAARIVAKAMNCQQNGLSHIADEGGKAKSKEKKAISNMPYAIGQFEPCNECEQCLSITAGNNLDVLEIDAASNRGIDDIRELKEGVKLAPASSRFKVYIIDEAHMLTPEAFNALLKTLEEPPEHVIFILCTTEPEKLPETIISRCQRFNFKKAKTEEVVEKLKKVVVEEKLEMEKGVLELVAKASGGSFRDSLKILEQASFLEGKITEEKVKEILGHTIGIAPEKLLSLVMAKDAKGALGEINRVVETGVNLRFYTTQILEMLREMLLSKLGAGVEGEDKDTETQKLVEVLAVEDIKTLIEIFGRAAQDLKEAIIPQLPLELAVVEWCGEQNQKSIRQPADKSQNFEDKNQAEKIEETEKVKDPSLGSQSARVALEVSFEEIQNRWKELLSAVRPRNFSIEAFLRASRPIGFDGKILTVEVFYQFHRDRLDDEKCRSIVEEVAGQLFGGPLGLKYTLGERPQKKEVKEEEPERVVPKAEEQVEDEEILKVAEEIFNGKLN